MLISKSINFICVKIRYNESFPIWEESKLLTNQYTYNPRIPLTAQVRFLCTLMCFFLSQERRLFAQMLNLAYSNDETNIEGMYEKGLSLQHWSMDQDSSSLTGVYKCSIGFVWIPWHCAGAGEGWVLCVRLGSNQGRSISGALEQTKFLCVVISPQMAVRMSNVAILRNILSWLLDHMTSAISNCMLSDHNRRLVSSSEYELSLSYCENGPSLDGIPSSCTGSVAFLLFYWLFSLGGLFSHCRPRDISFIFTRLFNNLKARIPKSFEMGQQTTQAKMV